ncbi:MAG: hypothetical protein ACYS8X_12065 [Planctomycetota bacterium]|jgi:hypothetical protein
MKSLTVLATVLGMLAVGAGCSAEDAPPAGRVVRTGMAFTEATKVLNDLGATTTELAVAPDPGERLYCYDLPGGEALIVAVDDATGRVTGLTVCEDPARLKVARNWRAVEQWPPGDGAG